MLLPLSDCPFRWKDFSRVLATLQAAGLTLGSLGGGAIYSLTVDGDQVVEASQDGIAKAIEASSPITLSGVVFGGCGCFVLR